MRYKAILLFGAPGSGKGTQGKIIGSIPGFFHSSTGDIFRSLDLNSKVGKTFSEYASRGALVPDDLTVSVWRQYIQGLEWIHQFFPESQVIVLDGMPRNLNQAKLLDDVIDVVKVIYLQAPDLNQMVARLRQRALKENRIDDANDAVIRKRLETYEAVTHPVLSHYPQDKIVRVDAMASQIRVLSEIVKVLVPVKETLDRETADRHAAESAQPAGTGNAVGSRP